MKEKKLAVLPLLLIILSLALYRVLPYSIAGFSPLVSCSLFSAALIRNNKLALFVPVIALLVSDLMFHWLYVSHLSGKQGFYSGQVINYVLIFVLTLMGNRISKISLKKAVAYSGSGSVFYFLLSNFSVWATQTGFSRPMTVQGLLQCYNDALLFYRDYGLLKGFYGNFIIGDVIWSLALFAVYYFYNSGKQKAGLLTTTGNGHMKPID